MICFYCYQEIQEGARSVEGLHEPCFADWFEIKHPHVFTDLIARSSDPNIDEFKEITHSFFHGKFRKYSAKLDGKEYLLKVQQPEVPELPATEFLCNQIADALGFSVPKFYLVRLQGALDTFVVENFMQIQSAANLIHIYRYLRSPQDFSVEGILSIIKNKLGRQNYVDAFVELCLYDSLIGNHDRHGRNLAFIESKNNLVLSPMYDNTSYIGIEIPALLGAILEPRGAIPTRKSREPTIKDYIKEFNRLGLGDVVRRFIDKIHPLELREIIKKSFICTARQSALLNLINRRYQEAKDEITI